MDPDWGHVTIKMSGHPPFGAQVILNGHEYVARQAPGGRDRFRQGGQLLHWHRRPAAPGPGRRHLVAARGYRAPEPGLRPVDLLGLPVLRPGPRRAGPQRVRLRLLGLPGRIQPQPAVLAPAAQMEDLFDRVLDRTRSRLDVPSLRTLFGAEERGRTTTVPAGRPRGSRDRDTSVRPDLVQGPLRAPDAEGLHQRRTRAALRGHRAQHQGTALRPGPGQLPEIITRLAGMADRFATTLDCVDITFLADDTLDQLPAARPSSAPPGSAAST